MRVIAYIALALTVASCSQFEQFDGSDDDDASGRDDHVAIEVIAEADVAIVDSGSDGSDAVVASDTTETSSDAQSDAGLADVLVYVRQCGTTCPPGYHWVSRSYDPVRCGDSGGANNYIVCMRD